jgi:hypothetical protein
MFQSGLGFGQQMFQSDLTQPNPRKKLGWVWVCFFGPNPTRLHPDVGMVNDHPSHSNTNTQYQPRKPIH